MRNEEYSKNDLASGSSLFTKDNLLALGLLIAAVALYTSGLGELPLRDWDEGIVAGVARNIWRAEPGSYTWLYPTINYAQPYWNKPPLIHGLIAITYSLFGVNEWSTRLIPALLSALAVPLLFKIGKEVFSNRLAAFLSAAVYLTLLPIARHSRVAMLDGAVTCWFCLAIWCLLRGRKSSGWLLGMGLAIGLVCLTKGIMMGVLLGGISLIFIAWDSPKLLLNPYLWGGFVLGVIPAIAWYGLQYLRYGSQFLGISLGEQTFNRIWSPVSNASSPPWYYLLEIAKYSLPWLIFLPQGIRLAIAQRHLSWSKLALVWSGIYLLAISLMVTKLPWYVIPIYPGLSLLIGVSLAVAWQKQQFPRSWKILLSLVTIMCWLGTIYYIFSSLMGIDLAAGLGIILLVLTVGFTFSTILLWLCSRYFITAIIIGFYLSLLLLFNSPIWLWELGEAFPVQPLAGMIKHRTPPLQNIYTSYPNLRPALEFYSDRTIIPVNDEQLTQYWQQTKSIYLLVDDDTIERLNLEPHQMLIKKTDNVSWQLITQEVGVVRELPLNRSRGYSPTTRRSNVR